MIKIALIDSGIDCDFKEFNVFGGINIGVDEDGNIYFDDKIHDYCEHGNLCASTLVKEEANVSLYMVKIFGRELTTNFSALKLALEHLLTVDVDIVNLSLYSDSARNGELLSLVNALHKQGKIIFWALSNEKQPHFLFGNPALWTVRVDNKIKDITVYPAASCISVNSLPYLHFAGNSMFKLFGSSTSYATARAAGIMAKYLNKYKDADVANKKFISDHIAINHFQPISFKDEEICYDTKLFSWLLKIVKEFFKVEDEKIILERSLFSQELSGHNDFCFKIIQKIEKEMSCSVGSYCELSKADFISIYTLYALLERGRR